MDLRQLRSFCTAGKLRSISKAANSLDLGQPAVTGHIKKLEAELGTPLFDRIKRPIQLTAAGRALLRLAEPLVEGMDQLAISLSQAQHMGPVRVASTYEIATHILPPVVEVFLSEYPHVQLRIHSPGNRKEVLRSVAEGEVDLAMLPDVEKGPEFDFLGLFPYERVLITPLNHPLLQSELHSLAQIAQWPLIMMGRHTSTRVLVEQELQRRGLSYELVVEVDSMDVIKRYVALGLGVSVGPRLAIDRGDERELGIVGLSNLLPVEQAGVLTLRGKTLSSPALNFISILGKTAGRTPPQLDERGSQCTGAV